MFYLMYFGWMVEELGGLMTLSEIKPKTQL